ncbi:hypothetical protein TcasGA2_TC001547 [Tribolium castaneum]|uniref:Uncharacterized protein n=1 Tax=Tribolium castaneum TaxID=7070 RepID=D6WFT5_TRICA|nr:hypothetical protein TcasGA2_TC001547 [Tribolium castaneum]
MEQQPPEKNDFIVIELLVGCGTNEAGRDECKPDLNRRLRSFKAITMDLSCAILQAIDSYHTSYFRGKFGHSKNRSHWTRTGRVFVSDMSGTFRAQLGPLCANFPKQVMC